MVPILHVKGPSRDHFEPLSPVWYVQNQGTPFEKICCLFFYTWVAVT